MMILGVVRILQPVHGYDVRRELLSWHAHKWANLQPGSIYHALKKLTDEGALRELGQEQVGGRPARTRYEVTPKGNEQFRELVSTYLWELEEGHEDPFVAAFSFLFEVPREETVAALHNRARFLQVANEGMRAAYTSGWAVPDQKPANVRWMLELIIARNSGEIEWCERVAKEIEDGAPFVSEELAIKWKAATGNDYSNLTNVVPGR
ncbi:MAG TPA: transcriptional regulator [Micromonosporaceae bacterium]|nr:transcriptional regulator [Micromonosporaceae bacterium]HCU50279.1 transcriptional regulator [Micromonosporaceae bacterium]